MGKTAQKGHMKKKYEEMLCPKCGSRKEVHQCIRTRHNHVIYGENGYFWVCTNEKCDYRERRISRRRRGKPRSSKKRKRLKSRARSGS